MSKLFPTCLLVQKESCAPKLLMTEVGLHPGSPYPPVEGKTILLAGGYSSITQENTFPLSSTLQLNFDLATFAPQELEAIARAELVRANEENYRSYTVEADNRVCAIGEDVSQLNRFIDTYGGILEIEPLLLKGYHPEIPTVTELNLDAHGRGCRLEYQVRSPINMEQCTYCGNCGPACPEGCISETLFLNYESCTFCKDCEAVCAAGAIDVHSALSKVLEVPAVIILGNVRVDLPGGSNFVYSEEQLSSYFTTLFPSQLDEVVVCDNSICQYSGRLGYGCDLCLSGCRYGAISQDEKGVTVDPFKCEECGACVSSCPTGALQNERFSDTSFTNYFSTVEIPQDGTVVIGDEPSLHELWWRQQGKRRENVFFLQYDNVQRLSLFHFMFLLNRGARRIVCLTSPGQGKKNSMAEKQFDLACSILNQLFDVDDGLIRCTLQDFDVVMGASVSGSFGKSAVTDIFINRRQALAVALQYLVKKSGREISMHPEGYIPFATVQCNTDRCTHCMACLNDCRIEALSGDQEKLTLNHRGVMCVGCGICVRVCPEDALTISPDFTLNEEFFTPLELAKAEPMACKSCGKVFGTKKSFLRVMKILSKKEAVDTSHFEYCDTCRVVKLFESH